MRLSNKQLFFYKIEFCVETSIKMVGSKTKNFTSFAESIMSFKLFHTDHLTAEQVIKFVLEFKPVY